MSTIKNMMSNKVREVDLFDKVDPLLFSRLREALGAECPECKESDSFWFRLLSFERSGDEVHAKYALYENVQAPRRRLMTGA